VSAGGDRSRVSAGGDRSKIVLLFNFYHFVFLC
jgi:hypothetical protein